MTKRVDKWLQCFTRKTGGRHRLYPVQSRLQRLIGIRPYTGSSTTANNKKRNEEEEGVMVVTKNEGTEAKEVE